MKPNFFVGTSNHARFLLSEKATGVCSALPVTYEINGPLDRARLQTALKAVIKRYPMLRSKARLDGADATQILVQDSGAKLELHSLESVDEEAITAQIRQLIDRQIKETGTQFCAVLASVGEERAFLTLIFHHSLIDGVSIGHVVVDLAEAYRDKATPDDVVPDHSYELFLGPASKLEKEAVSQDTDYWSQLLADVEKPVPLVAVKPNREEHFLETGCAITQITNEEHDQVRAFARKLEVRTFAIYLLIGQLVLQRMTGQKDVIASFQSAGRKSFAGSETAVGLFSRALVVRATEAESETIATLARQAHDQIDGGLRHELLPFQDIIALSQTAPRFAFNWYPVQSTPAFEGCTVEERVVYPWQTTFDLNFHFVRNADGVEFRLFNNRSHCDDRCAQVLAAKYRSLLIEALNQSPQTLPIGVDAHSISTASTPTRMTVRIEEAFLEVARSRPEASALELPDATMSYGQLAGEASVAASVFEQSARPQPKVMIVANRGAGLVVGALGALQSGGSFALIDGAYPTDRIKQLIDQLGPDVVAFTDGVGADAVQDSAQFERSNASDLPAGLSNVFRRVGEGADDCFRNDAAYYLFTSGSTGQPKCVVAGHSAFVNALSWQKEQFAIDGGDRFSFLSGVSHDPSLRDVFMPLLSGGTLCIPDPDRILEPGYVRGWLKESKVTVAHLTPAMAQVICAGRDTGFELDALNHVFLGGERASSAVREELREIAPSAKIVNVYGATETPQIVLHQDITENSTDARRNRSLGTPRDDVTIEIRDADGRTCCYFEPGEIVVHTPNLSYGYLSKPAENDPFEYAAGESFPSAYRTGDIAYHDSENGVVLVGRKDDQVKIRGYRVEPGEVTAALRAALGHDEAVVVPVLRDDEHQLVAFVGKQLSDDGIVQLTRELRGALPQYMLPEGIVVVESLPRLPNGKLDRQALLALPRTSKKRPNTSADQPRTESEAQLVSIWETVLGVSQIGVNESLFDLGGDSLTGVMLMLELEKNGLDERVSRSILSGATIREIAKWMDEEEPQPVKRRASFDFGPLLSRTGVHAARGVLVLLIIAGHWFPGVAERVSQLVVLSNFLTPVFNLSTPGFAIIFGVSCGYFNYETYRTRKVIFDRQQRLGIWLLLGAMFLISATLWADRYLEGAELTVAYMISSFYSVIGYYLLAWLSLPLWFGYFRKFAFSFASLAGILAIFIAADQLTQNLLPNDLPHGPLQLLQNYLAAKFSYFSLSIGALIGIYVGHRLRQSPALPVERAFVGLSIAGIAAGILWGAAGGELVELLRGSKRIDYWKWLIYLGGSMLLMSGIWTLLSSRAMTNVLIDWMTKLVASVGSLALFFFVFHGGILAIKGLFESAGLSDGMAILAAGTLFISISAYVTRKMWRLYF